MQDQPRSPRSEKSDGMNLGMRVLSYLIAGVAFYGFLGWLGDRFLGTAFLLPIGIVSAPVLAATCIIRRFGRRRGRSVGPARGDVDDADRTGGTTEKGRGERGDSGLMPLETGERETEGFQAPGVSSFELPPLFESGPVARQVHLDGRRSR